MTSDQHPHRTGRHLAADIDVAREAGHKPQSPLRAIRAKCLDCSCYQVSEVRLCEAVKCPLWPFRAGKHPWWGEGEKTCQTLADSDRQTAFQDEGSARPTLRRRSGADMSAAGTRQGVPAIDFQQLRRDRNVAAANRAIAAMRRGETLCLQYQAGRPLWRLSGGQAVPSAVATSSPAMCPSSRSTTRCSPKCRAKVGG